MFTYIIKKVVYGFLVLWGVLTLVFFLFNVLPGDPARMMLDKREDSRQLENIRIHYGFDRPLLEQYALYLNDLLPLSIHHNSADSFTFLDKKKYTYKKVLSISSYIIVLKNPYLRESFIRKGIPVSVILKNSFGNTFLLAITSISIALFLGLFLGILSALYKDTVIDKLIIFISVLGMSLPSFFASIIIAWFFGFVLHNYTGLEMTGSLYQVDDYGRGSYLQIKNLILPSITLGIRPLSVVIQLCRNSLLEVFSMDYIRTATAKGLGKFKVLLKHALMNGLNPIVTAVSGWFASMLAGAVFVEYIFSWNGLGKEIVDALNKMDLPVVMGAVLFIASFFVIINIIVDLIYGWLDPRIRFS